MQDRIDLIERPLRNLTCPYCGKTLDRKTSTKEHVVGRRFVPKGTLAQSLNVILGACQPCNVRKSDLEDEISALTMYPDLVRGFDGTSDAVKNEAARKLAKSRSRLTGKPIAESSQEHSFSGQPLPGLNMSFSLTSPPQLDEARAFDLAFLHVRAFFYAMTYNPVTRLGGFWPEGGFFTLQVARRNDWGNPIQTWFMDHVAGWGDRFIGYVADEHFGVAIRRALDSELWSFALEWNKTTRVTGFFGRKEPALALSPLVPELPMVVIGKSPDGAVWRMREETPLAQDRDVMFRPAGFDGTAARSAT